MIRSAHFTIIFDTGLPKDREFILTGVKPSCVLCMKLLWLLLNKFFNKLDIHYILLVMIYKVL